MGVNLTSPSEFINFQIILKGAGERKLPLDHEALWDYGDSMVEQNRSSLGLNPEFMRDLINARMPFGRYKGRPLLQLPEPYVIWFRQKGFPKGKLGDQLATVYEIKANGLEYLFKDLTRFET